MRRTGAILSGPAGQASPGHTDPLDQFYPAYLSFKLSGAPGGGPRQLDCFVVLAEAPGDRLKLFQPRPGGFMAPGIKAFHVSLTDNLMEPLLELVSLGEKGIGLEKRGTLLPF